MILFHSDLDNTLIYSYKRDIGPENICVEIYQGREISFMTREALELLGQLQCQTTFVPTTTRTEEQYRRIAFNIEPLRYALVCNGGILLEHGQRDPDWYGESKRLIDDAGSELERAIILLEKEPRRSFEIRLLEELFVFTKSDNPEETLTYLRAELDTSRVDVFQNGTKIYVVPKGLDKGNAVLRLKERLGAEGIIAAGDSEFDIPMLLAADAGMCPQGLFETQPSHVTVFSRREFTEGMLRLTKTLLTKEISDIEKSPGERSA